MTLRLLATAESQWPLFDGWCAAQNVDPWVLPASRMLSLIYFWANQYADEKELARFDMKLWIPPPNEKGPITEGPWTAEAEMTGFRGLAAALNVKTSGPEERSVN